MLNLSTIKKFIESKNFQLTAIILFLAFLSRTLFLKSIPISLHPDEKIYAVNAKSIFLSGANLKGDWHFWQLQPLTSMHAELPSLVMTIGSFFTKDTVMAAKIVSVVFSLSLPLILALLSEHFFKKKSFFYTTLIVASFNPWMWQFGRMAFDVLYGLWFYFLATLIICKNDSYKKLWSLPLIFLGFFQYQGLKLILVPIFGAVLLYQLLIDRQNKDLNKAQKSTNIKIYLGLLMFILGLFGFYALIKLPSQTALNRISNYSIFSHEYVDLLGGTADLERKRSLISPLTPLLSNKITVFVTKQWQQFFKIFNPQHLFIDGDAGLSGFSVWSKGTFYLADLFILIIFFFFPRQNKKSHLAPILLLLTLFLFGALPAFINIGNDWFTFRPSFSFMILIMFIAYALALIWEQYPKLLVLLSLFYLINVGGFIYDYLYRYPIYSANGLYFSEKILSDYLIRNQNRKIAVYSNRSDSYFEAYLTYNNLVNKNNLKDIRQAFIGERTFQFQNVIFDNVQCVPVNDEQTLIIKDIDIPFCENNNLKHFSIASLEDSGEMMQIYRDSLCSQYQADLNHYLRYDNLQSFNFSKLNDQKFCQKWITDLSKINI